MFTDYLIIDSRNYPNWTLIKLSKLLINGRTKFAKFINMDLDYPGSFKWTESQTIGNKMKGYYTNEAVLHAPESRTSSPVCIPRDPLSLQHVEIKGLYPCAEGAGYAGGIISAAIDGINCMDRILESRS